MITPPPKELIRNPLLVVLDEHKENISEYLELLSPLDSKGRYLPYEQLRFRFDKSLNKELAWSIVKNARFRQLKRLILLGDSGPVSRFFLTPTIQKAISETDRHTTNASLEWMCSKIGEEKHLEYLLNDLVEDEAISSSQLEGAATTTEVAKDLIKRKRKPRSIDEKMIVGNLKMMKFVWENREKDLSLNFIRDLHQIGVENIDDDMYTPGVFRKIDDVKVVDGFGQVVHQPPKAENLKTRLKKICDWVNTCHHDTENRDYLHPLVKAIVIHFAIGFEHPFRDGNGRVARALFYWFMFKNDFATFRYITISLLLKNAPAQYGKSYLYTETDQMDLTYFIDYQCSIVARAINKFKESYHKTLNDAEKFNAWLWKSGLYKKLTDKQQTVFQVARNGGASYFTASNVKENLACSYNTASSTLNGLVELKLFKKEKQGREWVFSMLSQKKILKEWKVDI